VGGFLGELSKRLAERWLSLLVLPGILYLAVAAAAHTLGQGHALDIPHLTGRITAWAKTPVATSTAGQIVVLAAILAGAAGAGVAAQALGSAVEHLTLAAGWRTWPWPLHPLVNNLTNQRRERWNTAHEHYHQLKDQAEEAQRAGRRLDPASRYAAYRTWIRIGLEQPDRPTWCGDRINAASVRINRDLNINLPDLWPYLWLHLPDQSRTEISTARTDLSRAATLTGWAVLYALLIAWWWPASVITIILALTAWRRTRAAADAYADLLEAAARLHLTSLASQFGLTPADLPLPALGATITHERLPTPPPAPALSPAPISAAMAPAPPDQGQPVTPGSNSPAI
jgi:hypothetical protein